MHLTWGTFVYLLNSSLLFNSLWSWILKFYCALSRISSSLFILFTPVSTGNLWKHKLFYPTLYSENSVITNAPYAFSFFQDFFFQDFCDTWLVILVFCFTGVRVGGAISMNPGPTSQQKEFPPLPPAPDESRSEPVGDCKCAFKSYWVCGRVINMNPDLNISNCLKYLWMWKI